MKLTMSRSMKPVRSKKYVMVGACSKVETGNDCAINNINETLASTGFGV